MSLLTDLMDVDHDLLPDLAARADERPGPRTVAIDVIDRDGDAVRFARRLSAEHNTGPWFLHEVLVDGAPAYPVPAAQLPGTPVRECRFRLRHDDGGDLCDRLTALGAGLAEGRRVLATRVLP